MPRLGKRNPEPKPPRGLGPRILSHLLRYGAANVMELAHYVGTPANNQTKVQDTWLPSQVREWLFDHDALVWCDSACNWHLRDGVGNRVLRQVIQAKKVAT